MLSYQHIYHAGNTADVHKHGSLFTLLRHLLRKDKPLSYLETHAGRGLYPLASVEMQKTGEFSRGAGQLLNQRQHWQNSPLAPWLDWLYPYYRKDLYPGSPVLARDLLPPPHQLQLMELHPQEFALLRQHLSAPHVHLHQRDGREGLPALSPPEPRRGLVLIDPSWEEKDDYHNIPQSVQRCLKRWPNAIILIWYPLLAAARHRKLVDSIRRLNRPLLQQEWAWTEAPEGHGMYGSGWLLVQPPWGVDQPLQALLACLQQWKPGGEGRQQWLIQPE